MASTSSSNEISESPENAKSIQNPAASPKVNDSESLPKEDQKLSKAAETNDPATNNNNPTPVAEKEQKEGITKTIKADIHSIQNATNQIHKHEPVFKEVKNKFSELENANPKYLREFKKVVKTLKQQISTLHKTSDQKEIDALFAQLEAIKLASAQDKISEENLPNLFLDADFEKTLQFKDFKDKFNELPLELKLCLLSFSVFPETMEIKKRVMVYWWIGEGFAPPINEEDYKKFHLKDDSTSGKNDAPERWANRYFKILLNMGFIESAQKKPNPNVDICTMHPFVRSMVSRIAREEEFFEFNEDSTVNEKFTKSLRACLLDGETLPEEDNELKKVHAVMNVDVSFLEFKQDSLPKMRNANVLYLGRWQSSGTHHIEVDDTKILNAKKGSILDGLRNVKNLKFLSLQGISRISELPKSISKLQSLTILDLRACHNLEKLPDDIGCLVNLTHLDMSECYLLDEMPKGISKLTKLQVLSGFVVLETVNKKSCTLGDLKEFPDLRKLSIHTGSDNFPMEEDLRALNQFKRITKLTIAWGRGTTGPKKGDSGEGKKTGKALPIKGNDGNSQEKGKGISKEKKVVRIQEPSMPVSGMNIEESNDNNEENPESEVTKLAKKAQGSKWKPISKMLQRVKTMGAVPNQSHSIPELPSQLTKLDLQCCPGKTHTWLRPEKLLNLEKLYIRGGILSDLGHFHDFLDGPPEKHKWEKVTELRLKYLNELEIDWKELLKMFPKLEYLEKAGCPKLSFFPCNDIGVWTRKQTMS